MFNTHIISTDEDSGLRIESFAVINLSGVSTNKKYYKFNTVFHAESPSLWLYSVSQSTIYHTLTVVV